LRLDSIAAAPVALCRTGRVQVVLDSAAAVRYGDYLELNGRLRGATGARNPGEFDYADYLERRDIRARFFARASDVETVPSEPPGADVTAHLVVPVRTRVYDALKRHIPPPEADLLLGLLFGERRGLSAELEAQFQNTGTLHLLAVSGGNVAVVIAVLWGALGFVRLRPSWRRPLIVAGIFVFARLSYNEPSVLRASAAAALATFALARHRTVDPFNLWGAALLLLLLWEPRQLFEIGFQLSFMATLGILAGMPLLGSLRQSGPLLWRALRALILALGVSTAAQVAVIPIMAVAFNQVPLVTPLSNLVCVPLAGLATAAGLVTLLLAPFGDLLHSTAAAAAWISVRALIEAVAFFDSLGFPPWYPPSPSGWSAAFYYAACWGLWLFVSRPRLRRALLFAAVMLVAGGLWHLTLRARDPLTIAHLDLRTQGCSAIRWPDGNVWLVLSGERAPGEVWANSVTPFLRRRGWNPPALIVALGSEADLAGAAREWPGARLAGGPAARAAPAAWPPTSGDGRVSLCVGPSSDPRAMILESQESIFIWYRSHNDLDLLPPPGEKAVWAMVPSLPWDYEKWLAGRPHLSFLECTYKDAPGDTPPSAPEGMKGSRVWSVLTSGAVVTSAKGVSLITEPSIW
jgi:competence protein ComEC